MNDPTKMSKGYVIINGKRFPILLAIGEDEQMHGLMNVEPPLTSMAFVYSKPQVNKFWMHNVKDDLDVFFCYKGKIIEIVAAEAYSTRLIGKEQFSDLVLEFPTYIQDKHNFKVGDDVKLSLAKEAYAKLLVY